MGVFLTLLGVEGLKIYDTFTFAARADTKKITQVLDLLSLDHKACDIVRACESSKAQLTHIGVTPDTGSVYRLTDTHPTRSDQSSGSSAATYALSPL